MRRDGRMRWRAVSWLPRTISPTFTLPFVWTGLWTLIFKFSISYFTVLDWILIFLIFNILNWIFIQSCKMSQIWHFYDLRTFCGVKFGSKDLLCVKDMTFCNSAFILFSPPPLHCHCFEKNFHSC